MFIATFSRKSNEKETHTTNYCSKIVFYEPDNEWECVRVDGVGTEVWDARVWKLIEIKEC